MGPKTITGTLTLHESYGCTYCNRHLSSLVTQSPCLRRQWDHPWIWSVAVGVMVRGGTTLEVYRVKCIGYKGFFGKTGKNTSIFNLKKMKYCNPNKFWQYICNFSSFPYFFFVFEGLSFIIGIFKINEKLSVTR